MPIALRFPASTRVIFAAVLASFAMHAVAQTPRLPETARRPVSDTYTGTAGAAKVTENYRWLETLDDPAVKDWVTLENAATRRYLDGLPFRTAIRDELKQLYGSAPVTRGSFRYAGGKLFSLKRQPPKNQPMLVVMDADDAQAGGTVSRRIDGERIVLDPNTRNEKGTTAIDWFVPSHDGKRVAVSLSDNGSEKGTLHVFDTDTGDELSDVVPRVQYPTGGGSVAWNGDSTGFWFTRYPAPMERPADDAAFFQQVWFHKLGTRSSDDTPALTEGLPRIAETALATSDDGRHVLATVLNGDGGEAALWLRDPRGQWRRLADFADGFRSATFGHDGRLYALGLKGSPRGRVVAMKLDQPTLAKAVTIVPQGDAVIEDMVPTATRLYVEVLVGGPSALRVYTLDGKPLPAPPVEPISTVGIGTRLDGDAILFGSQGYLTPFSWFRLDPKRDDGKPVRTALSAPPDDTVSTDDLAVTRVMAKSKDGTDVPVNLVAKKGVALDGSSPALLTAYGGYSVSTRPRYSRRMLFWLRHGGVLAVANIRGGGEFGEDWHQAGKLTRKQNVFDDFAACARMLVERGYTSAKKLAIEGGSNGGLLMGAELVQHPELFGAVVSHVGIYDMLRVETTPNGAFNVTEFGTVKEPAQFDALYAYSPYHHVVDGTAYPPLLMTTGINDGRVDPWQSLKMAARLQAANPDGKPVLLRVAGDAGHGQGMSLSSSIELDADTFAFLFASLGMDLTGSAGGPKGFSQAVPMPTTGPGLPQPR